MQRKDWSPEEKRNLSQLVDDGFTAAAIAKQLGRTVLAVEWQLSVLGLSPVEDAKGAECLRENKPISKALKALNGRFKRDPKRGYMVDYGNGFRFVKLQELCDLAGVARPYS